VLLLTALKKVSLSSPLLLLLLLLFSPLLLLLLLFSPLLLLLLLLLLFSPLLLLLLLLTLPPALPTSPLASVAEAGSTSGLGESSALDFQEVRISASGAELDTFDLDQMPGRLRGV